MSDHIQVVKDAIEFNKPAYLPMEILNVPGVYNAYHTLDAENVKFLEGTENFDSMWPCCYSWLHTVIGETDEGEPIKEDQFGNVIKTPNEESSSYIMLKNVLAGKDSLDGYKFPDPDEADPYMDYLKKALSKRYPDRFVNAHIDAGIFLTTMFLLGEENFLFKLADNPKFVIEIYERVMEYYKHFVLKYKEAGAHMITVIEDVGSTSSLLMQPQMWRDNFKPILNNFYKFVRDQGMYACLFIDGHSGDVMDDLLDMEIDMFKIVDLKTTGIDVVKDKLGGKLCVQACVDMQSTLPMGSPEEIEKEAHELVEALNSPDGGFMCFAPLWYRPALPMENAIASAKAFNKYRDGA